MSEQKTIDIAIAGATGEVGRDILGVLETREFPVGAIYPLASGRKVRRTVEFRGMHLDVLKVDEFDFSKVALAIFSMGGGPSETYAPIAAKAGCIVIDNSSHWRTNTAVPLVVAEINSHTLDKKPPLGIIANPNCSTMQLALALHPIYQKVGVETVLVSTYQAVSGAGSVAVEELRKQTIDLLNGKEPEVKKFPDVIGFNVIPHIDVFLDNGFTKEEMKMTWETKRIFEDDEIQLSATCVRVPVMYGHSESVYLTTKKAISVKEVTKLLNNAPGVVVIDEHKDGGYPTALTHAAAKDEVFVGRIRKDLHNEKGIHMWVVSDNVRKGASLNAVQLAEIVAKKYL